MKRSEMKMFFEGANGTVTGSCTRLVYTCGGVTKQILVDCGLTQDSEEGKCKTPVWSFNPAEIHSVLLTHAHIDHCGAIPLLYKKGFTGKVLATEATAELSKIMLKDSAKTSGLYEEEDVDKIEWKLVDDSSDQKYKKHGKHTYFRVTDGILTAFIRSSHILGASSIYVRWFEQVHETDEEKKSLEKRYENYRTILFSGDVGRTFDVVNPEATFLKPTMLPYKEDDKIKNILVLESTYGNRKHKDATDYKHKMDRLESVLRHSLAEKKGGYLVIPAFALDRTQTVTADLYDVLMKRKIFPDATPQKDSCTIHSISSLANRVGKIYAKLLPTTFMNYNDQIKYRYLNAKPEIPEEYQDELNKNDGATPDEFVRERLSILKERESHFQGENNFCVKNEHRYDGLESLLKEGHITIGASGMCDKGSIKCVVENALRDEKATIMLTGYTSEGSAGEIIKRFVEDRTGGFSKQERFNMCVPGMDIRLYEIKADIIDMSDYYSAHADSDELSYYVFENAKEPAKKRSKPIQIMLNHGSIMGGIALSEKLDEANGKLGDAPKTIITSRYCHSFDVSSGDAIWIDSADEKSKHEKLIESKGEKISA